MKRLKRNELELKPSRRTLRQFPRFKCGKVMLILLLATAVFSPSLLLSRRVEAATSLDPASPIANFNQEGTETFTAGAVLTLNDTSIGEFVSLWAGDVDASPGTDIDLVTTFQVRQTTRNNADAGNRVVINDGVTRSAIAACVVVNGVFGIGLYSQGAAADPASYPVFVPADWQAAPVTIRMRRHANGDAELIEVNGVAPTPRALLTADKAPDPTRTGFGTVEFGSASLEATCTIDYYAFRSERVVNPVAGTFNFTRFHLRDTDSPDRIQLRGDYTLGSGSDGINPAGEPVTIRLSTPSGGLFYPGPDFNPLVGFDAQGLTPKRRWTLNDSERADTSIERLVFDEDPNNKGSIFLRDFRTNLADRDFSIVNVEITIGLGATADKLTATANLVEKPGGSGRWRLANEH